MAISGVPVVIVPSGGVPVTQVASGAPMLTVSDAGRGVPITLAANAAPFVIEGGPSAPSIVTPPVISGLDIVGSTLTVTDNGTWSGNPAPTFTYQWLRDGVAISGATSSVYEIVEDDLDANLSCRVTATNSAGTISAVSNALGPVVAAPDPDA